MPFFNHFGFRTQNGNGDELKGARSKSSQFLSTTSGMIVFGALVIFIFALSEIRCASDIPLALRTFSIAMGVALAAMLLGGLFGFLFGIPKSGAQDDGTRDRDKSEDKDNRSERRKKEYLDNTNLVEISDWLTKILVGAGLVTLTRIPPKLEALAEWIGSRGFQAVEQGAVFALVLIVFYAVCGFLWSYVWTRLYFASDLRDADGEKRILDAVQESVEEARKGVEEAKKAPVKALLLHALALPPQQNDASAQARREEARRMGRDYLDKFPTDREIAIPYGRLLEEQFGQRAEAIELLRNVLDVRRSAREKGETALTLKDDAALMYNIACYLNRDARAFLDFALREKAIALLREAIPYDGSLPYEIALDPDLIDLCDELGIATRPAAAKYTSKPSPGKDARNMASDEEEKKNSNK